MRRLVYIVLLLSFAAAEVGAQTEAAGPKPERSREQLDEYGEDGLQRIRRQHRSAKLALAMSIPVPGWGQLYADSPFWSVVAFGAEMYYLGNILLERRRLERQKVKLLKARTRRDQEIAESGVATSATLRSVAVRENLVTEHREKARDFIWFAGGGYLLLSIDAYVSVELADFDANDPPTPDLDRNWDETRSNGGSLSVALNFSF